MPVWLCRALLVLFLLAPAHQSSWATPGCLHYDMIKAVCHPHRLVLSAPAHQSIREDGRLHQDDMARLCAICTALFLSTQLMRVSGHLWVPALGRHDHGCALSAPPCTCRCISTEQLGHLQVQWFDTTLAELLCQNWHSL